MHKGQIMSKDEFLRNSQYAKEEYEGLLVSADTASNQYKIGIQLDENRILLVDQVPDHEVHHRINQLVPQITELQRRYRSHNDLQNYQS
ncbi:MAG TPA: hypothetical protein PLG09_06110 [Syntrophomonadaceae bacterium]|jgi:hypothetical protein|nr:hypothetical protein [Syntrophomonadaceae bacterium]HOQ09682.1 hypothetical protein [Syntrophomonadaceae bacterium]HPU49481.1 hypothetical protein [Syntrophomonadaceae bacterium]